MAALWHKTFPMPVVIGIVLITFFTCSRSKSVIQNDGASNAKQCWSCLSEEGSDEWENDELISPCKCSGTSGHVHVSCLSQIINTGVCDDSM